MPSYTIPAQLAQPHSTELCIRRSRFLTQCAHTASPEEARAFIETIRCAHADATHNCWAYAAGRPGDTARIGFSDDGEPHGTAGRPMLQVLLHSAVGEICMVVSRWFGGVKLGTGGLVRAYQDSVQKNLETLPLTTCIERDTLNVTLPYTFLTAVKRMLAACDGILLTEKYQEEAQLTLALPTEQTAQFLATLANVSNGSARIGHIPTTDADLL